MTWSLILIPPIIKVRKMPITYDLETDIRYLQGVEKKETEDIRGLVLQNILTDEQIAQAIKVPLEEVRRIRNDMELDADSSDNQNA